MSRNEIYIMSGSGKLWVVHELTKKEVDLKHKDVILSCRRGTLDWMIEQGLLVLIGEF